MKSIPALKQFDCPPAASGRRVDLFISDQYPDISRSKIQKCIDDGFVTIHGVPVKKRTVLKEGDVIILDEGALLRQVETHLEPQEIALSILFEDENFVVINKPAGMVVHPGSGNRDQTLVNALLFHSSSLSTGTAGDRPGIVHRLDKNTSGVIAIAKNDTAHNALGTLFAERNIAKEYVGFTIGIQPKDSDTIDAPVGRKKNDPLRYCVRKGGKEAVTEYTLSAHSSGISLMRFRPRTGRTHQIRVHSSFAGFPIVADDLYGGDKRKILNLQPLERPFAYAVFACFSRHALHAWRLSFRHPFTQQMVMFEAPLPQDFQDALKLFENVEGYDGLQ